MIHKYPYTNFHELNLDWIVAKIKEIEQEIKNPYTGDIDINDLSARLKNAIFNLDNEKSYYLTKIGTLQNADQIKYTTYGNYINFGEPNEPPLLDTILNKGVNVIAHFYNDFGLKSTAMAPNQENGSWKWYDWSWNFTTKETYDPARHPLLGWYQGDDRKTLDWILYWLGKAGVNSLSIVKPSGLDMTNWEAPSNVNHWFYVLMNECKNISSFKIIPWLLGAYGRTTDDYDASLNNIVNFINQFPNNINVYTLNGKKYVTIYCWEIEGIRGTFDNYNGYTNTLGFFRTIANAMQTLGYNGVCILGRHVGTTIPLGLIEDGIILYESNYSDAQSYTNYYEYANADIDVTNTNKVLNVMTSCYSSPEHTSAFNVPGSTPELFQKRVNNSLTAIQKAGLPNMLTIYNVSEWAEGGPGLIPNMQDGFGYLDALSGAMVTLNNIDAEMLKEETKDYIFSASKNLIVTKKRVTNIPAKSNAPAIVEFNNLYQYFESSDNMTDYVFIASIEGTDLAAGITAYARPNFTTRRIYAHVYNDNETALTNLNYCYVCMFIIKINI